MELSDSRRMKAADKQAIEQLHIPSLRLMETAAAAVVDTAEKLLPRGGSCVIFSGPGNNGGDGIAAARILSDRRPDADVRVYLVGDRAKMTEDSISMEQLLNKIGLELLTWSEDTDIGHADLFIDAIFGIGLRRPIADDALAAVLLMKSASVPVIAVDIASGVDADTGLILGDAAPAAVTVTFSAAKPGHFIEPGCECVGKLKVIDIGIPSEIIKQTGCGVYAIGRDDLYLPRRKHLTHKGDYGKLLVLGGSIPYTGAPSLCAQAAVRSGAGLVYTGVPSDIYEITAGKNAEAMVFPLKSNGRGQMSAEGWKSIQNRLALCDVCVIGPGMGRGADTSALVELMMKNSDVPVVADADALWAIAQNPGLLDEASCPMILTPHEGEFASLLGRPVEDRISDAIWFAREHECVLVLKGFRTICAFPDGRAYVIHAGNPGMATGGSGDVLAGVIGAMLSQLPSRRAVITAVWLHAHAGDLAAEKYGEYGMKAGDIIDMLPAAEMEIIRRN